MSLIMLKTMTLALQATIRLRGIWADHFLFLIVEHAYQLVAVMRWNGFTTSPSTAV